MWRLVARITVVGMESVVKRRESRKDRVMMEDLHVSRCLFGEEE